MKVDDLIVGQGLAGSLLAWHLLERNRRVLVVDRDEAVTSSKVAAGLVTPISGQQFSLPEETALNFAKETYWAIEEELSGRGPDQRFFHHLRIARFFTGETEVAKWRKRLSAPGRADLYRTYHAGLDFDSGKFHGEHGGIEILKGGWLDVAGFVEAMRIYLLERVAYAIGNVNSRDVEIREGKSGFRWKNITAENVIFCEGWKGTENHFFQNIPMNNAKGDILRIRCETIAALPESRILNRNGWILPLGEGVFRAGSSYDHDFAEEMPTPEGRTEVEGRIRGILKPEFEVIGHDAAVRPIIRRSRVFMGRHPVYPGIVYFNGLGSKGVINAPSRTLALVEHLIDKKPLDEALDIREHFSL